MTDLADRLLSEEIHAVWAKRQTGILEVSAGEVAKGIFFRKGHVAFASSSQEADKLGENLIRLGRISRAEFTSAYKNVASRRQRLGQALVHAGRLSEEEMGRLVARQVETIILSLFMWTSGEATFFEGGEPIPEDLALDLSTHRLLLEGLRVYPDVGRLEKALGSLERRLRPVARPLFDLTRAPLSIAERTVLEETAGGAAIADILAGPTPRPLLVRATYALLLSGVLEDVEAPAPQVEAVVPDAGTFRMAMAAPAAPTTGRNPAVGEVQRAYAALKGASHYVVLEILEDATEIDVAAAFSRLSAREWEWRSLESDLKLGSAIGTLKLRWKEAYEVLSDPRRREEYDRSLAGAAAPPPAPEPTPTAPGLLHEAEILMEKGGRERALPLLMKAVDLDPKYHPGRRLLAIALAKDPTLAASAERHFLAALEQEPRDVDLRHRLAIYYRKMGLAARAILQLRIVLKEDPDHAGAWRDLQDLEKETRSGG